MAVTVSHRAGPEPARPLAPRPRGGARACALAFALTSAAALSGAASAAPATPGAAAPAAAAAQPAAARARASSPVAPAAAVGGVPAAEWTVRWWRWAHSFPAGLEPYLDRDGRRCAHGQDDDGPVWFLAGTDGSFQAERRCRVPAGKHLLVPVINMYFHGPRRGPYAMDCAQVQRRAAVNNDYLASAVVLLDGKPLPQPARLASRCFDPQSERDDAGPDANRGELRAAADGYWLLLPPLAPGPHRLSVGANYGNPDDPDYGRMLQNFEYRLQVGDPAI